MAKKPASSEDEKINKLKTRIEKMEISKQIRELRAKQKAIK